jgi:hypothetical protein
MGLLFARDGMGRRVGYNVQGGRKHPSRIWWGKAEGVAEYGKMESGHGGQGWNFTDYTWITHGLLDDTSCWTGLREQKEI